MQWVADRGRRQHLLDAAFLAIPRQRVAHGIAVHQHRGLGQSLLGGAEIVHAPARLHGPVGRVGGAHRDPAQIVGIGDVVRAAWWARNETLGHAFGADRGDDVAFPTGNHPGRRMHRNAAGGAAAADIGCRNAGFRHCLQHLVGVQAPTHATFETRTGRDQTLQVLPFERGVAKRRAHRVQRQLQLRLVRKFTPGMGASTQHIYRSHVLAPWSARGRNLYVNTSRFCSSR